MRLIISSSVLHRFVVSVKCDNICEYFKKMLPKFKMVMLLLVKKKKTDTDSYFSEGLTRSFASLF